MFLPKLERNSGFTLIEMLIVIGMIGILTAIALPAYNGYVNRSKIKTAQADLVALSLSFENAYQRTLAYPATEYATHASLLIAFPSWGPASSDFTFTSSTTGSYTLTATGNANGVSGCQITINKAGTRTIGSCSNYSSGSWL